LLSGAHRLVREVTARYEDFDTQHAGAAISAFVDDLSNWYVRRSRRRFWDGDPSALWTLHEVLGLLTRLMAPLTPFITERVWQDLYVASGTDGGAASVHLTSWPVADEALIDEPLESSMALARQLVELGRAARAEAKVKIRQPLARALVSERSLAALSEELRAEILAELNVGELGTFRAAGDVVDHTAKGNFRALGKRFGQQTPLVASAIADADASRLAASLAGGGTARLNVPGLGEVELTSDDVLLTERPREGWSVLEDCGETIALDLELTPELVAAGTAREVVRAVQDARKASGFDVSDRIRLVWAAGDDATAQAIRAHADEIAAEVLATAMIEDAGLPPADGASVFGEDGLGFRFTVARV